MIIIIIIFIRPFGLCGDENMSALLDNLGTIYLFRGIKSYARELRKRQKPLETT